LSLLLISPHRHEDHRGWFGEVYSATRLSEAGLDVVFVQDNESFSRNVGTARGLHFQRPPSAQAKLIGCLRGAILDVVVDIRRGSPTFGRPLSVRLTDDGTRLFVPVGYAHGFVTLTPDTLVAYKVSAPYDPSAEDGINWRDPVLGLSEALPDQPTISARDAELAGLHALDSPFVYDGVEMALSRI